MKFKVGDLVVVQAEDEYGITRNGRHSVGSHIYEQPIQSIP